MPVLTPEAVDALDREAATRSIRDVVGFLADALGTRMTAHLAGLNDVKQISRYRRPDGPAPGDAVDRRLRAGFKVVQTIAGSYDAKTARAWLFGTNARLDDRAPIDVLRQATEGQEFIDVLRAARQLASFEG
jgi:hypothetical protein